MPAVATVQSPADARLLAASILHGQRSVGINEMCQANSVEEAMAKARLLFAASKHKYTVESPSPAHRAPSRTRCLGSVEYVAPAEGKGGACFVGDEVQVLSNSRFVKMLMEASAAETGGWNNLMEDYCGKRGRVTKVLPSGLLQVTFGDGEKWLFPSGCLQQTTKEVPYHSESPCRSPSPRRDRATPGASKALLIGIDYRGDPLRARSGSVQDCHTMRRFLLEHGFQPAQGWKILCDEREWGIPPTRENIISSLRWLCEGARTGDSLFLMIGARGGDGVVPIDADTHGNIPGGDVMAVLRELPAGSKLTVVVDAHCGGGGGALLDLPFTLKATRDGGHISTKRPRAADLAAEVVVYGTWAEGDGGNTPDLDYGTGELVGAFVQCMNAKAKHALAAQLLAGMRRVLLKVHGAQGPLPMVASTRPVEAVSVELSGSLTYRAVHPTPAPVVLDYVSQAAARLPQCSIQGRLVALGDAEARAWIVVCDGRSMTSEVRLALYNGHPSFTLSAYNWVDNDHVSPLGDTITTMHPSGSGMVYQIRVRPGETKMFLEGTLHDGENWRPGWRQEPLNVEFLLRQQSLREAAIVESYHRNKAVADLLQTTSAQPVLHDSAPFTAMRLIEGNIEASTMSPCLHYDLWFPPQPASLSGSDNEVYGGEADPITSWGRPADHLPPGTSPRLFSGAGPCPSDVSPGRLRTLWFLGAAAAVAESSQRHDAVQHVDLMSQIFCKQRKEVTAVGAYVINLCSSGWWYEITVDSWLPLHRRPHGAVVELLAFAHCSRDPSILWPALLEKAQAKLIGSYAALDNERGHVHDALSDLTGCPAEDLCMARPGRPCWGWESRALLDLLQRWCNGDTVVVLTAGGSHGSTPKKGYPYTLLQVLQPSDGPALLQVRDLWGAAPWPMEVEPPSMESQVVNLTREPDGTRWVTWQDAVALFREAAVCHVPPPSAGELRLWMNWGPRHQPPYVVHITVDTPTVFSIAVYMQNAEKWKSDNVPLRVTLLGQGHRPSTWAHLASASEFTADHRRVFGQRTIHPSDGAVLLVVQHTYPGAFPLSPEDGVVITLHYHQESLPGSGVLTTLGPASTVTNAMAIEPIVVDMEQLCPVETTAQQRAAFELSHPPTEASTGSVFSL
eukprot:Sspe_Gene.50572::Locus_28143_Transcript_1_1_Confidence_1.000_Length_3612::g.50572::m.50572